MVMVDITWAKYEKDIKTTTGKEQEKAIDAFEDERNLQMKTSAAAREWEKGRKKEIEKNKPIWRKEKDDKEKERLDKPFKNLLKGGTFISDLKPCPGYVLISYEKTEAVSESGIIIAQDVEESNEGIVLEVGSKLIWDRTVTECPCKVGDKILFKRGAGLNLTIKEKSCKLIYFNDILGVFYA